MQAKKEYTLMDIQKSMESNFSYRKTTKNFKILKEHGVLNGNLKKKLSLVNKLKSIENENMSSLLIELEKENLSKFQSEMINNILLNLSACDITVEKIHDIFEIIYLFSFDGSFINSVYGELKKIYLQSHAHSSLFIEVFYLLKRPGPVETVAAIKKILQSIGPSKEKSKFIYYIICSFCITYDSKELDSLLDLTNEKYTTNDILLNKEIILGDLKNLFSTYVEDGIKEVGDDELVTLQNICNLLKIDKKFEAKNENIVVINPIEDEFKFYQSTVSEQNLQILVNERSSKELDNFINSFLKNINKHFSEKQNAFKELLELFGNKEDLLPCKDIHGFKNRFYFLLDFVGIFIKNNSIYFDKFYKKMRDIKNFDQIKYLAKILSKSPEKCKKIFSCCFKNSNSKELVLVGELYKFKCASSEDVFGLMDLYLNKKHYDKVNILFKNVGRYLLINKATQRQAAEFIDRINSIKCVGLEKNALKECVEEVINPKTPKINTLDFFSWYFSEQINRKDGLFEIIQKSRRLCLLIFSIPRIFINAQHMADIVEEFEMTDFMIEFYSNNLHSFKCKNDYFQIIEVLTIISSNIIKQKNLLNILSENIMNSNHKQEIKYKSILKILEALGREDFIAFCEAQKDLIDEIKKYSNLEIRTSIFNLYEKNEVILEREGKSNYDDEFDNDVLFMRGFSD